MKIYIKKVVGVENVLAVLKGATESFGIVLTQDLNV